MERGPRRIVYKDAMATCGARRNQLTEDFASAAKQLAHVMHALDAISDAFESREDRHAEKQSPSAPQPAEEQKPDEDRDAFMLAARPCSHDAKPNPIASAAPNTMAIAIAAWPRSPESASVAMPTPAAATSVPA